MAVVRSNPPSALPSSTLERSLCTRPLGSLGAAGFSLHWHKLEPIGPSPIQGQEGRKTAPQQPSTGWEIPEHSATSEARSAEHFASFGRHQRAKVNGFETMSTSPSHACMCTNRVCGITVVSSRKRGRKRVGETRGKTSLEHGKYFQIKNMVNSNVIDILLTHFIALTLFLIFFLCGKNQFSCVEMNKWSWLWLSVEASVDGANGFFLCCNCLKFGVSLHNYTQRTRPWHVCQIYK